MSVWSHEDKDTRMLVGIKVEAERPDVLGRWETLGWVEVIEVWMGKCESVPGIF